MTEENPFVEAKKERAKLRMAISGPSGSGKTWTSLLIAEKLAELEEGKIAFLDTEGRSARKYADRFNFDVYDLSQNYNPQKYIDGILAAARFGYKVIVIDSFSHAWNGSGGVLEIVDAAGKKMGGNDWAGWSKGRPAQSSLVDALINADIHVIGTMRTKTDWVLEPDARGKNKPVKKGLAPVQSADFEYEFDVVMQISMEHQMTISKSRCSDIAVNAEYPGSSTDEIAGQLHAWLTDGVVYVKPEWYEVPDNINEIVKWAKSKNFGSSATALLNLIDKSDWSSFANGREACVAIQNASGNTPQQSITNAGNSDKDQNPPTTPQIVPKTAGESFLKDADGKNKLKAWLNERELQASENQALLEILGVSAFGEVKETDEAMFYVKLEAAHARYVGLDAEKPEPQPEPQPEAETKAEELFMMTTEVLEYDGNAIVVNGFDGQTSIKVKCFSRTKFAEMAGKEWAAGYGITDLKPGDVIEVDNLQIEYHVKTTKTASKRKYGVISGVKVLEPEAAGDSFEDFFPEKAQS